MSDDTVTIEIDGKPVEAVAGQMLIEVTDRLGRYVPRFCYHDKLSVAANCRMCLVEVEKAPKPLPACATPVMNGMKVHTRSELALDAQKSVMEFLLINHPLDCPICDQGGECELQDLAMGYGRDVSRYQEKKRVVQDKNIGPLVQTDMTRCIHCTRCVRFGEEIAGLRELGATGRGEFMEIGTYIEKSMASELSGNVIDLCPVGALTSKPFRFTARTWELTQHDGIAVHDGVGANLHFHVKDDRVKRVAPAENEAVNEVWLSDRDRFSYEGLNSAERLTAPMIRGEQGWQEVDWQTALEHVSGRLRSVIDRHGADGVGALVSPSATCEELYLAQKFMREILVPGISIIACDRLISVTRMRSAGIPRAGDVPRRGRAAGRGPDPRRLPAQGGSRYSIIACARPRWPGRKSDGAQPGRIRFQLSEIAHQSIVAPEQLRARAGGSAEGSKQRRHG